MGLMQWIESHWIILSIGLTAAGGALRMWLRIEKTITRAIATDRRVRDHAECDEAHGLEALRAAVAAQEMEIRRLRAWRMRTNDLSGRTLHTLRRVERVLYTLAPNGENTAQTLEELAVGLPDHDPPAEDSDPPEE